jgi:hypothetical protein
VDVTEIDTMPEHRPAKLFTIEEANQTLPLVRAITADLVQLTNELVERRQRLAMLTSGREREVGNPYSDELAAIEAEIEKDAQRLREFVDELIALGVEPKSAMDGLIDFPAMLDGRLVYLCWKLGEPEVIHWHEVDAGFAGRQTIAAEAL